MNRFSYSITKEGFIWIILKNNLLESVVYANKVGLSLLKKSPVKHTLYTVMNVK